MILLLLRPTRSRSWRSRQLSIRSCICWTSIQRQRDDIQRLTSIHLNLKVCWLRSWQLCITTMLCCKEYIWWRHTMQPDGPDLGLWYLWIVDRGSVRHFPWLTFLKIRHQFLWCQHWIKAQESTVWTRTIIDLVEASQQQHTFLQRVRERDGRSPLEREDRFFVSPKRLMLTISNAAMYLVSGDSHCHGFLPPSTYLSVQYSYVLLCQKAV